MVLDTRLRYNPISSALVQSAATCIVTDVCMLSILSRSSSPGPGVGIAGNAMINNGGGWPFIAPSLRWPFILGRRPRDAIKTVRAFSAYRAPMWLAAMTCMSASVLDPINPATRSFDRASLILRWRDTMARHKDPPVDGLWGKWNLKYRGKYCRR